MMRSAHWRRMALPILCFIVSACGKQNAQANDPNAPAVVKAPPVVLASDTAKKPDPLVITEDDAHRRLLAEYSLVAAAITLGDRKLIAEKYASGGRVITSDTTFVGSAAISNGLGRLGAAKSLRDFQRSPRVTRVVDSTVVDSGTYAMISKRPGSESVIERGSYATVWQIRPAPLDWFMIEDHLFRDSAKKPAKKAK
jgi:hypothetical protein